MSAPTSDRVRVLEENARALAHTIGTLDIDGRAEAVREIIERHRPTLEQLLEQTRAQHRANPTSSDLARVTTILETVLEQIDSTTRRLDAWKWIGDSSVIVGGITNDVGVILSIAIATLLAHISKI